MRIKWYVWLLTITAFLVTLYLVELGPWSARQVGKYNDGYGTFDMKNYNANEVTRVLSQMAPEGFPASYRYYINDTVFLVFFGLLQVLISLAVYNRSNASGIYLVFGLLAIGVPVLRGVLDLIENGLLVYTLKSYPALNTALITAASIVTKCKLMCIRIWAVLIGIGLLWNILRR